MRNFVDPVTGANTQGIERAWKTWKKNVRDSGPVHEDRLNEYLYAWVFRHNRQMTGVSHEQLVDDMINCWS